MEFAEGLCCLGFFSTSLSRDTGGDGNNGQMAAHWEFRNKCTCILNVSVDSHET